MANLATGYGLPLAYLAGLAGALAWRAQAWRMAVAAANLGLLAMLANCGFALLTPAPSDVTGLLVGLLVAFLGWVVVRFSRRYLEGEPGQYRYVLALLTTLAAVGFVILTQHLGVLALAWCASSLGLHHLLTFYPSRFQAIVAAHKKFIASRLADACFLASLGLLYANIGSLDFATLKTALAALPALPLSLHLAAVLACLAVILKSAQLPLHGWLIQVMEAPTPVSALLHAGIVNLGCVVLLRLAPLVSMSAWAQALLVLVGGATAVLAGLVMLTRISIKVRLAWSTCAQMGFMLMEVGLGLYDMALAHLLGHSLYKAHAFLTAGEAVLATRRAALLPTPAARTPGRILGEGMLSALLGLVLVWASSLPWGLAFGGHQPPLVALFIAGLALAALPRAALAFGPATTLRSLVQVLLLAQAWLLVHYAASTFGLPVSAPGDLASGVVIVLFTGFYALQLALEAHPGGALARRLFPLAYGGFYLDEHFTRQSFRLWPPAPQKPSLADGHLSFTVPGVSP